MRLSRDEDVIYRRWRGESQRAIAERYGLSISRIQQIEFKHRLHWRHRLGKKLGYIVHLLAD